MEDRVLESSSTAVTRSRSSATPHESRNIWVLTAYGISALGLLGILVYYFSTYVTN